MLFHEDIQPIICSVYHGPLLYESQFLEHVWDGLNLLIRFIPLSLHLEILIWIPSNSSRSFLNYIHEDFTIIYVRYM